MTAIAGASSAPLSDDMPDDPFLDEEQAGSLGPATAEMAVIRPVPRPQHLAHPNSPVGRTNDGPEVDPIAHLLVRPIDQWSDAQLLELSTRVLEARHARRWGPQPGRHRFGA